MRFKDGGPALVLALLTLAVAACSTPNPSEAVGVSTSTPHSAAQQTAEPALFSTLSDLDMKILRDRSVTDAEYSQAVQESVRCLQSRGFTVSNLVRDTATSIWHFDAEIGSNSSGEGSADGDEAFEQCDAKKRSVEAVFIASRFPVEPDDGTLSAYRACIRAASSTSRNPSDDEVANMIGQALNRHADAPTPQGACDGHLRRMSVTALPGVMQALEHALTTYESHPTEGPD